PASIAALAARYRSLESRFSPDRSQQWLNWAIRRLDDTQCVGFLQATVYQGGVADFAFVLGTDFWGKGLAREASRLVLFTLFADFGVVSVFATTDQRNARSVRLLTSLGFTRVQPDLYSHGKVSASDDVFRLNKNA